MKILDRSICLFSHLFIKAIIKFDTDLASLFWETQWKWSHKVSLSIYTAVCPSIPSPKKYAEQQK